MSVKYEVLNKFLDIDYLETEFHRVTNDIKNIDIEYGIDVIFNYYRKFGFPHYTIRDDEKYDHMRKLKKFDVDTILDEDKIVQTMHCLRLAWTYFPHFWEVRCGGAKMSPMEIFLNDDTLKSTIRKTWNFELKHYKGEEGRDKNKFHENRFRQSLKIYSGTQSVSNFRPTAAKLIYEKNKLDIKPSMIQPIYEIKSLGKFKVKIFLHLDHQYKHNDNLHIEIVYPRSAQAQIFYVETHITKLK